MVPGTGNLQGTIRLVYRGSCHSMATFRKRSSKSGSVRWQAIIRKKGQTLVETFTTKTQAQVWAREQELRIEKGGYLQQSDFKHLTVRDLMQDYVVTVIPKRRGQKHANNRFAKFMREPFANLGITRIGDAEIEAWKKRELARISPPSVARDMNELSSFFTWCIKDKKIPILNPMSVIKRPEGSDVKRDRTFTWGEIKRLLKAMRYQRIPSEYTGKALVGHAFLLAARTAMRLGEICSVEWKDIHLDEQYLHLRMTKNGEPRDVPLSTKSVRLLRRMKMNDYRLIPVSSDAIGVYFRYARDAVGLHDAHFHDTRHHATTQLAELLPSVLELSAVTGHKSLKHLQRYYNPKASALAKKLG